MKENLPVTQREKQLPNDSVIFSMTDLKGQITYINKDFIDASGFDECELLGQSHNIVRHPDMPPQAFADLWKTIQGNAMWTGIVKNRCKDGDHYWVRAISMPVCKHGQIIGYQSVRFPASPEEKKTAEELYRSGKSLPSGKVNTSKRQAMRAAWLLGAGFITLLASFAVTFVNMPDIQTVLLGASGLTFAFAIPMTFKSVFKPLATLQNNLFELARGNLNAVVKSEHIFKLGGSLADLASVQARFRATIDMVTSANERIESASHDLAVAAEQTLGEAQNQNEMVAFTKDRLEQNHASIIAVAEHVRENMQTTTEISKTATEGAMSASEAIGGMDKLLTETNRAAGAVKSLRESSNDVTKFVAVIQEIAEKTNLLALNAAIEAARAGESGRGFAVVAEEVRTLASKTQEETVKIESIIERLKGETVHMEEVMVSLHGDTEQGAEVVEQAAEKLAMISGSVKDITQSSENIASEIGAQGHSTQEVLEQVETLQQASERLSEAASVTEGHAETMQRMTASTRKFIEPLQN